MKQKIIQLCLLFLLAGCAPMSARPNPTETSTFAITATRTQFAGLATRTPISTHVFQDNHAPINAFKPGENCPNLCWMGIHVGTTSAGQAVTLLKNAKNIEQVQLFGSSIQAVWLHHGIQESETSVSLQFSNGVIESMSLHAFEFFNVGDLLSVLGEPDSLNIHNDCGMDSCTDYLFYYSTFDTTVKVWPGGTRGLAPTDPVTEISVNMHKESPEYLQPWLGYGHLTDYLKKPMPTSTPYRVD